MQLSAQGRVQERIAAFREAGVTVLNVSTFGSPEDQIATLARLRGWTA